MEQPKLPPRDNDLAGLDVVRVIALGLVTVQHSLTLLGRDEWTMVWKLSIGQLGVALFLVVSGLLASESRRPPVAWLIQRLRRVYPAYWIAIAASFLVAGALGHKTFDAWQVSAQMAGIGLFTHLDNLVNSPTWFVSLLLACYLGTFIARLVRMPLLIGVGASLVLWVFVWVEDKPWLASHLLSYALASTIALVSRKHRRPLAVFFGAMLIVLAMIHEPMFGYAGVALLGVELCLFVRRIPRFIRLISDYSYEYYLVHGVFLFGMVKVLPAYPLAAVALGIVMAAVAGVVLHWMAGRLERIIWRT